MSNFENSGTACEATDASGRRVVLRMLRDNNERRAA